MNLGCSYCEGGARGGATTRYEGPQLWVCDQDVGGGIIHQSGKISLAFDPKFIVCNL